MITDHDHRIRTARVEHALVEGAGTCALRAADSDTSGINSDGTALSTPMGSTAVTVMVG